MAGFGPLFGGQAGGGPHAPTHVSGGSDAIREATSGRNGLMAQRYADQLDNTGGYRYALNALDAGVGLGSYRGGVSTMLVGGIAGWPTTEAYNILTEHNFNNTFEPVGVQRAVLVGSDPVRTYRRHWLTATSAWGAWKEDAVPRVGSVDGVTPAPGGNVDLVAGTNVTITPDNTAKTVTIAASGGGTMLGFRAPGTGTATFSNGTAKRIPFAAPDFIDVGTFDATNSRWTAPAAGKYLLGGILTFSSASVTDGSNIVLELYKNGALLYRIAGVHSGSGRTLVVSGSHLVNAAANDFFELWATYFTSGVAGEMFAGHTAFYGSA